MIKIIKKEICDSRKDEYDKRVKEFNNLKENLRKGIENL